MAVQSVTQTLSATQTWSASQTLSVNQILSVSQTYHVKVKQSVKLIQLNFDSIELDLKEISYLVVFLVVNSAYPKKEVEFPNRAIILV